MLDEILILVSLLSGGLGAFLFVKRERENALLWIPYTFVFSIIFYIVLAGVLAYIWGLASPMGPWA